MVIKITDRFDSFRDIKTVQSGDLNVHKNIKIWEFYGPKTSISGELYGLKTLQSGDGIYIV